jgi:hypothetical protein
MTRRLSRYLGSRLDAWTIEYRVHATQRMFKRFIEEKDVTRLLARGSIVEEYQNDFPFPSVLINGVSGNNRPLHAVVGIDADSRRLYLITVYEPDPEK